MKTHVKLPVRKSATRSYRVQVVKSLAQVRREWQGATENQNLIGIKVSVGLLFSDIANQLQLNRKEQIEFLGGKLFQDLKSAINQPLDIQVDRFHTSRLIH